MAHSYAEPDPDEGFLYVRELEDHMLMQEFRFLLPLFQSITDEITFRAENPDHRDGTGEIFDSHAKLYDLGDDLATYSAQFDGPDPSTRY